MEDVNIDEIDLKGDEIWDLLDSLEPVNTESEEKVYETRCIGCNSINLELDNTNGIVVCLDCSLVNRELLDRTPDWTNFKEGKTTNSRCGCPTNYFLPKSSLGTKVKNGRYSRLSMLERWGQMPYKERSLLAVLNDIEKRCLDHKVSPKVIENAKILFKHINDSKHEEGDNEGKNIIIRGLNRQCLIAACVFNGATLQTIPLSPKEIGEIFDITEKQVTRGCRKFREILKTNDVIQYIKSSQSHDFISRKAYINKLNLDADHIGVAKKIAQNVKKLDIAPDHQPRSIAAGSVMLMSTILDLNISKKNISDTFKISQVTIMKTYRKIFPYRKVLINDDACSKIMEIMKKDNERKELIDSESDQNIEINKEDYDSTEDSLSLLNISNENKKELKNKSKPKNLISRYL